MQVFESLGATAVVHGGQTMNPSTEDLLLAVESVPSNEIIILPNNKNIVMAAEQAAVLSGKNVAVVPTISAPQGISALLALNYQADLNANALLMASAVDAMESAEITTAVRSAQINGMEVQEGEIIGLINGELRVKGDSRVEVSKQAFEQMHAGEAEIITIYYGDSVTSQEAEELAALLAIRYPEQEIEVVDGGQPHYHYILSAE
jgi:dihydroxyacetone kinase-like predicted kinase